MHRLILYIVVISVFIQRSFAVDHQRFRELKAKLDKESRCRTECQNRPDHICQQIEPCYCEQFCITLMDLCINESCIGKVIDGNPDSKFTQCVDECFEYKPEHDNIYKNWIID